MAAQERAKSAPSSPAVLSCFKSQFVLLPTDLAAREPRRRSRAYLGDQNQQVSLVQVHPQDVRTPTALTDWKLPNLYFSSQWPALKLHNNFQEHKERGVKHHRVFQKFPFHFSSILPLKPEISKNLEPTMQFLQNIHLFFSRFFFQRIFSGYVGRVTVILSTDRAGLCSASAKC